VSSELCENTLTRKLPELRSKWSEHCSTLHNSLEREVERVLKPKFDVGVQRGEQQAMATIESWSSGEKRSKDQPTGAVGWNIYQATVNRDGVYCGPTCEIDMSGELGAPVQAAFVVGWEHVMNTKTNELLHMCREALKSEALDASIQIREALRSLGIPAEALERISQTAGRLVEDAIKETMADVGQYATAQQRQINRALQPQIQERMLPGYRAAARADKGKGFFQRMTNAVASHAQGAIRILLHESMEHMLDQIHELIEELNRRIFALHDRVASDIRRVYSGYWEREATVSVDVEATKAQATRDACDRTAAAIAPMLQALQESRERAGVL
jgi:hypothetical protein